MWHNRGPIWPFKKERSSDVPSCTSSQHDELNAMKDVLVQKGIPFDNEIIQDQSDCIIVYPPELAPLKVIMNLQQAQLYIDRYHSKRDWDHIKN
jgi:hypothetical protein